MPSRIEISPKTIFLIVLFVVGGWFLIQIKDVLFLLFISFIMMSALRPIVDRLEKVGIPRGLGILTVYIILIAIIVLYGSFVFPPLISESARLINNLPQYIGQLAPYIQINPETLLAQVAPLTQNVARFTVGVLSNIISILTVLVFAFYFLLERNNLTKWLEVLLGSQWGEKGIVIVKKCEERMGAWVRGQLLLMIIIGQATYIGLALLGINYALPLALIAGLLEAFPIIGPNIAAIPAILIALTQSPGQAIAVVAFYIVIQQLENNFIVPTVMRKTVGLAPLASLLALMIGGRLGGIVGVILAVPILLVIQTVVSELMVREKIEQKIS